MAPLANPITTLERANTRSHLSNGIGLVKDLCTTNSLHCASDSTAKDLPAKAVGTLASVQYSSNARVTTFTTLLGAIIPKAFYFDFTKPNKTGKPWDF